LPLILHFSAEERFTKWDIASIFGEILGRGIRHLKKVDQIDQGGSIGRPKNVKLDNDALRGLGINVETVEFRRWWEKRLGSSSV
jgi:S-adenosylmethionine synthetase